MFYTRELLSAYLVSPYVSNQKHQSWNGFRTTRVSVRRKNPPLRTRSLVALAVWGACIGCMQSLSSVSTQGSNNLQNQTVAGLANTSATASVRSGGFATVIHAAILPNGPSGQLLPPGTMAGDSTYSNTYASGQCTWYVAGRRQIPGTWGNAQSWYFHAASSGWSVGTTPAVAAVAWTPAGRFGHVALVEQVSGNGAQVYVSEMNYRGIGVKSFRWVAASQFKYIY